MANTGQEIVLTIEQVYVDDSSSTGVANQNNTTTNPNYIPPFNNLTNCPVTLNANCPTSFAATPAAGVAYFEFSIPSSAFLNTAAIATVKLQLMTGATIEGFQSFVLSTMTNNYFTGSIAIPAGATVTPEILYLSNTSSTVATCTGIGPAIVVPPAS